MNIRTDSAIELKMGGTGTVTAPITVTDEMVKAGYEALSMDTIAILSPIDLVRIYKAMHAART